MIFEKRKKRSNNLELNDNHHKWCYQITLKTTGVALRISHKWFLKKKKGLDNLELNGDMTSKNGHYFEGDW